MCGNLMCVKKWVTKSVPSRIRSKLSCLLLPSDNPIPLSLSLSLCVCVVCVCVQVTFESDPRQQFLNLLGYDHEELEQKVCT